MKSNRKFEVIIISAFGRQAELPGTNRIYSLLKGFYENGIRVHLIIPDLPYITETDLKNFDVQVIKKGIIQKIITAILSEIQKALEKKAKNPQMMKPVYKTGSRLMGYYTFFFYSKTPIPILRSFWSAKKLSKKLFSKGIKPVVITSVAPGCYLFVGKLLKIIFGNRIVWIADYQDPIEDNPFLNYKSNRIIKMANNFAFKYSDVIIAPEQTVIETISQTAIKRGFEISNKCYVLKPGIDFRKNVKPKAKKPYSIIYGGTIYFERIPGLKALLKGIKSSRNYIFLYAGFTPEVVKDLSSQLNLSKTQVRIFDVLPKPKFEKLLEESDILLALGTFGGSFNAPGGKIYSLLAYDKPLLIITPKTKDLEELAKTAGGVYLSDANKDEIIETLKQIEKDLENKNTFRNPEFIEKNSDKVRVSRFISEFL